ncbi:MAG: flagellar basal body P-ring formation protein FlgA [Nitrospinae bacterium]|nr:flagellar basal body P-ring formation protein FlgA [Nitrospinota bacterium]
MALFALAILCVGDARAATFTASQEHAAVVPLEEITRQVTRYIMDRISAEPHHVRITNVRIQGDLRVPRAPLSYEIIPRTRQLWPGPVSFTVVVRADGRPVQRLLATGNVEVSGKVVVAAYPLARNHLMTEADIRLEERHLAQLPQGTFIDPQHVLGKRTRQGIGAGSVLHSQLLEAPPLIKRGAVVTILGESPWVTVVAQGQAKGDGARGEQIRVVNLSSRKEIYAEVVDASTVRVDFATANTRR